MPRADPCRDGGPEDRGARSDSGIPRPAASHVAPIDRHTLVGTRQHPRTAANHGAARPHRDGQAVPAVGGFRTGYVPPGLDRRDGMPQLPSGRGPRRHHLPSYSRKGPCSGCRGRHQQEPTQRQTDTPAHHLALLLSERAARAPATPRCHTPASETREMAETRGRWSEDRMRAFEDLIRHTNAALAASEARWAHATPRVASGAEVVAGGLRPTSAGVNSKPRSGRNYGSPSAKSVTNPFVWRPASQLEGRARARRRLCGRNRTLAYEWQGCSHPPREHGGWRRRRIEHGAPCAWTPGRSVREGPAPQLDRPLPARDGAHGSARYRGVGPAPGNGVGSRGPTCASRSGATPATGPAMGPVNQPAANSAATPASLRCHCRIRFDPLAAVGK